MNDSDIVKEIRKMSIDLLTFVSWEQDVESFDKFMFNFSHKFGILLGKIYKHATEYKKSNFIENLSLQVYKAFKTCLLTYKNIQYIEIFVKYSFNCITSLTNEMIRKKQYFKLRIIYDLLTNYHLQILQSIVKSDDLEFIKLFKQEIIEHNDTLKLRDRGKVYFFDKDIIDLHIEEFKELIEVAIINSDVDLLCMVIDMGNENCYDTIVRVAKKIGNDYLIDMLEARLS